MNKKGVSPLVATILLIAFAVSVGAIVMSWAAGIAGSENTGVCGDVVLTVTDTGRDICLDRQNNFIEIIVENGPVKIDGFRVSYLGGTSNIIDYVFAIEAGAIQRASLDYNVGIYGNPKRLKVIPFIKNGDDRIYCTNAGDSFESIPECS